MEKVHVYLDDSDDHRDYFINHSFRYMLDLESKNSNIDDLLEHFFEMDSEQLNIISISENIVNKRLYESFKKSVGKLCEFLKIFKSDLQGIEIDKKEDRKFKAELFLLMSLTQIFTMFIYARYWNT